MQDSEQPNDVATGSSPVEMRLVAAGFNGLHQIYLCDEDVKEVSTVLSTDRATVLFAGWSNAVIAGGRRLLAMGLQRIEPRVVGGDASAGSLHSGFGDHDGMKGCLDNSGRLYLVEPLEGPIDEDHMTCARSIFERRGVVIDHRLFCRSVEPSPLISHIALAQNGRIVVALDQAPEGLCHMVEFGSFDAFRDWFDDPRNDDNHPEVHHTLPGRAKQLSASTACFILLMETGDVYTWGDARYESLARSVNATPADRPGLVDALGGLKIVSISTGGWMSAAVSEDGALYVWGAMTPGSEGSISCLDDIEAGGVLLVEILGPDGEPLDISDVAVGDNHILAIGGEERHVYAVGDNRSGQLGLKLEQHFVPEWKQVTNVWNADSVSCGPKTSWAIVRQWM